MDEGRTVSVLPGFSAATGRTIAPFGRQNVRASGCGRAIRWWWPLFALAALLSSAGHELRAQTPDSVESQPVRHRTLLGISPSFSIGIGSNGATLPIFPGGEGCGVFTDPDVTSVSAAAELRLPERFAEKLGAAFCLGWSRSASAFATSPLTEPLFFDPITRRPVSVEHEYRMDADIFAATLDALLRYDLPLDLAAGAGVGIAYRYSGLFDRSDNVTGADQSFADGARTKPILNPAEAPTLRPFGAGVLARLDWSLRLRNGIVISPFAQARIELLNVVAESRWRDLSATVGMSILYDLTPPPPPADTPRPRDTIAADTAQPVDTVPARPPTFVATIEAVGLDDDGRTRRSAEISVGEVIVRNFTPLLPVVYFDADSAAVPARYRSMTQREARSFSYGSVAELSAFDMAHEVTNIVGYRMREDRNAHVVLYGGGAQDERPELGLERAGRIRDYLVNVWGIRRTRIDVRAGAGPIPRSDDEVEDGRSENRRVVFASTSPDLLGPVATERIVRDFNPPRIRLSPSFTSEAGVAAWTIAIRQGATQLATFSHEDAAAGRSELSWQLDERRIDSSSSQLVAELRAVDSAGQVRLAYDSLALVMRRDVRVVDERRLQHAEHERLTYALVAFGYRSSTGDRGHELWLRDLAGQMNDNARVRVTGYTDRTGDDAYNAELSRGRAQYATEKLRTFANERGLRNITFDTRGVGAETSRYPNDLPEGRVLSRGAVVVVEQAVSGLKRP